MPIATARGIAIAYLLFLLFRVKVSPIAIADPRTKLRTESTTKPRTKPRTQPGTKQRAQKSKDSETPNPEIYQIKQKISVSEKATIPARNARHEFSNALCTEHVEQLHALHKDM